MLLLLRLRKTLYDERMYTCSWWDETSDDSRIFLQFLEHDIIKFSVKTLKGNLGNDCKCVLKDIIFLGIWKR